LISAYAAQVIVSELARRQKEIQKALEEKSLYEQRIHDLEASE
jgi:hypothetical protein